MHAVDVVRRFLESVGTPAEVDFYWERFRDARESFAAFVIDQAVVQGALEAVVLDLRFLAELELTPVVALGLHEPGHALEHATAIASRLADGGVASAVLHAGEIAESPALVAQVAARRAVPIVAFAPNPGEQGVADARLVALGQLLTALRTRRLLFLNRRGGLRPRGQLLSILDVHGEIEPLLGGEELSRKQKVLAAQARRLIAELVPHPLTVSIVSPLNLLRELFTVKGAGTLLRRAATIERRASLDEVDRARLQALLAHSFGRPPLDGLFTRPVARIFLEEGYRGVAIVEETPLGAYLSKFAVEQEARGEGLGRDLWRHLTAEFSTVFWRARAANPINDWYAKQADGLYRTDGWVVFWKGLAPERIPEAIAHALAAPIDIPPA